MDRGTDPMELEGESSDSPNTPQSGLTARRTRGRRLLFYSGTEPRQRLSSGTDEASASHSSTNFLTPPEPDDSPPASQPLLASSSDPSTDSNASETPSTANIPRRNLRFDITLPSFTNFRSRSPSASSLNSPAANPPTIVHPPNSNSTESTRRSPIPRLTLNDSFLQFTRSNIPRPTSRPTSQNEQPESSPGGETEPPAIPESGSSFQQLVRSLVSNWCNRTSSPSDGTSTEVPSGVDSENEDSESYQSFPPEPLTEDESQSGSGRDNVTQSVSSPSRNPRETGKYFI